MNTKIWTIAASLLGMMVSVLAQPVNRFIIIDQFGYLPESQKIAVIKDPVIGFDSEDSFIPGQNYIVVNSRNGARVFRGQPVVWNSGSTDASSGDRAWHFDFSSVVDTGQYYLLDSTNNQRSYEFKISADIYHEVLKHAVRSFYYQRAGFPKEAQYAGAGWSDGASHVGPLQDKNCRLYNAKNNPATEKDLSGGWYDAGDYNKYTNWTANYIVEMMKAYIENPEAWSDDYNIPESGNGIPDLLDEAKWGIDHLQRMQQADGGVLSIVSLSGASPPSSATGQSVYGPATTSASLNTAAAFAISARVFRSINNIGYADSLILMAERAWNWAIANPAVLFNNNSSSNGSQGVGAGNQEENDYGRLMSKLESACFLFEVTGKKSYRDYFNANYNDAHLFEWNYAYPYEPAVQDLLLYYTQIPGASATISSQIRNTYRNAMENNSENFPAYDSKKDPYLAHMNDYTWGSNNQKGAQGSMYYNVIQYNLNEPRNQDALDASLGYIHYIHGVNPLNIVYLSNMYDFGGDSCVNEFYHTWFANGSAKWDRVGTSLYGPPPGFVPGGPNPYYNWDGCCETPNCGSAENNALCTSENLTPPLGQPKQKSYKDFNTSWPLNSWSVTENSCGYQISYIKLLSKFVKGYDCNGVLAGTAYLDDCGICSGGNTGREPVTEPCNCPEFSRKAFVTASVCEFFESPSGEFIWTASGDYTDTIPAADACDSIIFIQLTVNQHTEHQLVVSSCEPYISPSGKIWTQSGVYTDTITNGAGCDSIITIELTVPVVNVNVEQSADTLIAPATDASYRWLDCDNYQAVEGATNQKFSPSETGNYAVEVTWSGCVDTSECFSVAITGLYYNSIGNGLKIYPNPANSNLSITLPEAFEKTEIDIRNLTGQTVLKEIHRGRQQIDLQLNILPGIYVISIKNNLNQEAILKLAVE